MYADAGVVAMNDQIAFSLKELLAFGTFIVVVICAIIGIVIKIIRLGSSVKQIKENDLTGFVGNDDFEEFKDKCAERNEAEAVKITRIETKLEDHARQLNSIWTKLNAKK